MLNLLKQLDKQEREFFIPKNYEQTKKLVKYDEDADKNKRSSRYRRSRSRRDSKEKNQSHSSRKTDLSYDKSRQDRLPKG